MKSYLLGLFVGFLLGSGIVALVWDRGFVVQKLSLDPRWLAACLLFGAIGASLSVMIRITRRRNLDVDVEQGRFIALLAGVFRPVIGAVLGAVLLILVKGGLVPFPSPSQAQEVFFYAGLAFLAGFSERWAQDTIVHSAPKLPGGVGAGAAQDETPAG